MCPPYPFPIFFLFFFLPCLISFPLDIISEIISDCKYNPCVECHNFPSIIPYTPRTFLSFVPFTLLAIKFGLEMALLNWTANGTFFYLCQFFFL